MSHAITLVGILQGYFWRLTTNCVAVAWIELFTAAMFATHLENSGRVSTDLQGCFWKLDDGNTDTVFISTPALPFFIPFNIYVEVQLFKEGSPGGTKMY